MYSLRIESLDLNTAAQEYARISEARSVPRTLCGHASEMRAYWVHPIALCVTPLIRLSSTVLLSYDAPSSYWSHLEWSGYEVF